MLALTDVRHIQLHDLSDFVSVQLVPVSPGGGPQGSSSISHSFQASMLAQAPCNLVIPL